MQNEHGSFAITETQSLTEKQLQDIRQLVKLCCRHDHIRLSYPAEISSVSDGSDPCSGEDSDSQSPRHWLLYGKDGILQSALALHYYQDSLAECSAFTHPDFRRRGRFSRLLDCALSSCEDCDILFTVSGHCPDTMAVLCALDAVLDSTEHQMEMELTNADLSCTEEVCTLQETCDLHDSVRNGEFTDTAREEESADTAWKLIYTDPYGEPVIAGSCRTFMVSEACACLHHVEILPLFRRQGFGYTMMRCLLPRLYQNGVRRVILQVSGDNQAALALYKKTGFRITETLSVYLY